MRSLGKLAGIGLALALLAGCQRPVVRGEWDGLVPGDVLAKASLEYYWKYKAPLQPGEKVVRVWRLDENVYALTDQRRLLALDAVRGLYKWTYDIGEGSQQIFAPCHADAVTVPETGGIAVQVNPPDRSQLKPFNAVIINTLSKLALLNRDTGERVRRLDLGFAANTGGCSDGTYFFAGSVQGFYYAVRLSEGLTQWKMVTGDIISAAPRCFSHRLYVAGNDGIFRALNPDVERDRMLWKQKTDGPLTADFVADARGCFVPSQDRTLYAYDGLSGAELWTFRTQGILRQGVQVGPRSCFQYAEGDRFYAVNIGNGRKRWDIPEARLVLASVDPNVLVLTDRRLLLVVNEALGKVEMSVPLTGLDFCVPNAAKPVLFAATEDGRFVCIRPVGAGALTPELLKDEPGK